MPSDQSSRYQTAIKSVEKEQFALRARRDQLIKAVLQLYATLGGFIAIGGLGYLTISLLNIDLNSEQRLALLVAASGGMVSLLSMAWLSLRRTKELYIRFQDNDVASLELVSNWIRFEHATKDALKNPEVKRLNTRASLMLLQEQGLIDTEDTEILNLILRTRNHIIYGDERANAELAVAMSSELERIRDQIEQRSQKSG